MALTLSCKDMQIGKRTTLAGFDVSCLDMKPTQVYLEAVKIFQVPITLTMLRGFLGLANQLANLIPDGAETSTPLLCIFHACFFVILTIVKKVKIIFARKKVPGVK